VDRRGHDIVEVVREPPRLAVLAHEALDDADLGERFVGRSHRFGDPVLDAGARASQRTAKYECRRHHDRGHGQRGYGESRVSEHQERDAAHEQDHLSRELRDPRVAQRLQDCQIGGQSARQLAGPTLREIGG